jgi:UDP-N-acetylmuramoyl-tripeptide--D-alanyl-D-alanine ligase
MNDFYNGLKIFFKFILKYYLKYVTKLVLVIYRPLVIGVSGSINVLFTQNEIKRQLNEAGYEVRSNPKNFNTEIGLPLAILNLPSGYNSYRKWLPIIWQAFKAIFLLKLPKILVLGLGVAKPGDMKYLTSLVKPKIAIITDITQRYIESFDDMDELMGEYEFFIKSIKKNGFLILNHDNPKTRELTATEKVKTIFFGLEPAEERIGDYWRGQIIEKNTSGQKIRIFHGSQVANCQLNRFGQHHVYALLTGLIIKKIILSFKQHYAIYWQ